MAPSDSSPVLPRKARVVAAVDLPGIPAGTPGKVVIVNGLTWIRYWVRFENGVAMGSLGRDKLATPAEWEWRLAGGDETRSSAGGAGDGDADEATPDAGSGVAVNGVVVPDRLIERSKAARARLSA